MQGLPQCRRPPLDIGSLLDQAIREHPDFRVPTGPEDTAALENIQRIKAELMPDIVGYAKSQGHDALMGMTPDGRSHEMIVFDKNQIVSHGERFEYAGPRPLKPMTDVRGTPMESELAGHAATVEAKTGIRLVDREFKPGELPAADEQAPTGFKGATRVALADVRPGEFEPGKQGAMVIMPDGKIWRVDRLGPTAEEKAAALEEGRAGSTRRSSRTIPAWSAPRSR